MCVCYTYTYIIEYYQQVFLYNEEVQCTSHIYTLCAQVLELPQPPKAILVMIVRTPCFHDCICVMPILQLVSTLNFDVKN